MFSLTYSNKISCSGKIKDTVKDFECYNCIKRGLKIILEFYALHEIQSMHSFLQREKYSPFC